MSRTTFLDLPDVDIAEVGRERADVAILGIPFGVPYPSPGLTAGCADAPEAIRVRSRRLAHFADHHDFDLDAPMLVATPPLAIVDAGDVAGSADDGAANATRAESAVRTLLDARSIPIVLGGDDSVPIPALRAYAGRGPLTVLQIDAHVDFRDEVHGVREGYSSAMRRAAEMGHVERIVQVGLRGVGSARTADVADARAAGNQLVTARELRERGVAWLLGELPPGASVFVVFDLDGVDPSVAPAVSGISPGGLSYHEAGDLIGGVAQRCNVAGAAFTELVPALDSNGLSALVVVRMVMRLLAGLDRNRRSTTRAKG